MSKMAFLAFLISVIVRLPEDEQPNWPLWYDPVTDQPAPAQDYTNFHAIVFPGLPPTNSFTYVPDRRGNIPEEEVDLFLETLYDQEPSAQFPEPSRTLVLGIRNLGRESRHGEDYDAGVFPFGIVYCESPNGKISRRRIPELRRPGRARPLPSVKRGERFYYPGGVKLQYPSYQHSVSEWFGPLEKEGLYYVWWEYKTRRSNCLVFERKGPSLTFVP